MSSSMEKSQFIAGRFIVGFGVAFSDISAPAYLVEISPPQWRGRFAGLYSAGCVPVTARLHPRLS